MQSILDLPYNFSSRYRPHEPHRYQVADLVITRVTGQALLTTKRYATREGSEVVEHVH